MIRDRVGTGHLGRAAAGVEVGSTHPLTSPHTHKHPRHAHTHTPSHSQVLTLHNLREFDASGGGGPHASYTPRDPEILELLSRDPRGDDKHPFQAAMDDCLMITIKGIAAGMQNTG